MLITLYYNVDNYVKVLCLLCFETWIILLCVRVVRTVLLFCLRVADSICLCDTDIFVIVLYSVFGMLSPLYVYFCVYIWD